MSMDESIPLRPTIQHTSSEFDPYVRDAGQRVTYPPNTTLASPPAGQGYILDNNTRPQFTPRVSSYDAYSGMKHMEQGYTEVHEKNQPATPRYEAQNISLPAKPVQFFNWLKTASILVRWIVLVFPVLAIIWIPGVLNLTLFHNARVWGVKLLWWSIWLSVLWGGWWTSLIVAHTFPRIARYTIGNVAVQARQYISWLNIAIWVSWTPLIIRRQDSTTSGNVNAVNLIAKILFGILLCAAVLLGEKFAIQFIAATFHQRTYADRIAEQQQATQTLVTLYKNSHPLPGQSGNNLGQKGPSSILTRAFSGIKGAAQSTTTTFGNLATEILGSSIIQPNSPEAIVIDALGSATKTRLLAQRIYASFIKPGQTDGLVPADIAKFFPTAEAADEAFALFDRDGNGDATLEEVELACMDCHNEQLSIANSLKDLDSAVGRLDNIFIYFLIAALIVAVVLDSQLTTLLAGVGTFVLGLSWLIGGSLAEVLTSIIFLFIKHPYDVGDRVVINATNYTVQEIMLLSTIFLDKNNTAVQVPHIVLSTAFISNIRRSPTMSETFAFDVAFDTTFSQIEQLRVKMLAFVVANKRDFMPSFDITVIGV
ncbi:hypothetical protein M422DRAFT_276512 [Sphaerobolus stellatus SS14]|uniref:EF-hand domain-containing protein n=1 Tax=Sphaerobolus stellatus (strain SS14) TaxID=990650 RepID=A0A0C9UD45_SPHS4|nr:hypothetical protein M422DRAFT_276512 [Sphaerobolus stellatus SS14]